MTANEGELPLDDLQGLIVSSFSNLPVAAYVLLEISEPIRARAWLATLVPAVTTAEGKQDRLSINVAFTARGLRRLGLTDDGVETLPHAFRDGLASERRSRILGDVGSSDPATWTWGGPTVLVDVLVLIYAIDADVLAAEVDLQRAAIGDGLRIIDVLAAQRQPDSREHFGFNDGVGQPAIKGSPAERRQLERTGHVTSTEPGEVILGHLDEYGQRAPSPDVAAATDPGGHLRPAVSPDRYDLGLNGSYLVFRQLAQHVTAFWAFVADATKTPDGSPDPDAMHTLAAKMVGRWPSGASLIDHESDPHAGTPMLVRDNDFEYAEADPHGLRVPIGSHIRRSNPRDSLGPDPVTAKQSVRRHRLVRRGRLYGDRIADPLVDDGQARGLYFVCLNSDLERQFEFVQQTWINNRVFGGQFIETDPIVGNQHETGGRFSIPELPVRRRIHGLPEFVTVVGGAYFLLPSLSALRYLADLRDA